MTSQKDIKNDDFNKDMLHLFHNIMYNKIQHMNRLNLDNMKHKDTIYYPSNMELLLLDNKNFGYKKSILLVHDVHTQINKKNLRGNELDFTKFLLYMIQYGKKHNKCLDFWIENPHKSLQDNDNQYDFNLDTKKLYKKFKKKYPNFNLIESFNQQKTLTKIRYFTNILKINKHNNDTYRIHNFDQRYWISHKSIKFVDFRQKLIDVLQKCNYSIIEMIQLFVYGKYKDQTNLDNSIIQYYHLLINKRYTKIKNDKLVTLIKHRLFTFFKNFFKVTNLIKIHFRHIIPDIYLILRLFSQFKVRKNEDTLKNCVGSDSKYNMVYTGTHHAIRIKWLLFYISLSEEEFTKINKKFDTIILSIILSSGTIIVNDKNINVNDIKIYTKEIFDTNLIKLKNIQELAEYFFMNTSI